MEIYFLVWSILFLQHGYFAFGSVHNERIGITSVSKNCNNKPCFQGTCDNGRCRCFAGWGGEQCDHCHGRVVLSDDVDSIVDGPQNYTASSRCMWIIEDKNNTGALLFKFNQFETECSWDHVYFYDGNSVYGEELLALSGTQTGRQFSAKSGKALVFFFSDIAFQTAGFDISFSHVECKLNCSSNGDCVRGKCQCFSGFAGEYCQIPVCKRKGDPCGKGECVEDNRCICNQLYHGNRCQKKSSQSIFETVLTKGNAMSARASHASVVVENRVWIVGGSYFPGTNHSFVTVYDILRDTWESIDTKNEPSSRYDHSLVNYGEKLYMFGGVTKDNTVTAELWSLNMSSLIWVNETATNFSLNEVLPIPVSGHKAHVIENEMFIFYGYNPTFGLLHKIQKYNMETRVWTNVVDEGPPLYGRFGHSLVTYKKKMSEVEVILIYGGFMASSEIGKKPSGSNSLVEYRCNNKTCTHKTLKSGLSPVFRHSASLINRMMIVIGGNGQNETAAHSALKCYSDIVQQYDIECETWSELESDELTPRHGHTSIATKRNIFIFGGFDGSMLNDVIKFTPGRCEERRQQEECINKTNGVHCVFHSGKCKLYLPDSSYSITLQSLIKPESGNGELQCGSRFETACSGRTNCSNCTAVEGCSWCVQSRECIVTDNLCVDDEKPIEGSRCLEITNVRPCAFARNCFSCKLLPHCRWYPVEETKWRCKETRDIMLEDGERLTSKFVSSPHSIAAFAAAGGNLSCPKSCTEYDNCEDCFKGQCMWCPTVNKCIALDTYLINFPYGQCQTWITSYIYASNKHICQLDPSDCSKQKTCIDCQNVGPSCGWCDDGSGTGVGRCLPGSLEGPLEPSSCPVDSGQLWYFSNCSACQCNGHSNCTTVPPSSEWMVNYPDQKCIHCNNNTTGEHCQYCADMFFGDPRNGGICQECQCNKQARSCNRETGDCYCFTKGVIEKNCSKCDEKYIGDPANGQPCYYELVVDFIFTFNLDNNDPNDQHVTQINFYSVMNKRDTDVVFTISCETVKPNSANITLSLNSSSERNIPLISGQACGENPLRRTFSASSDRGYEHIKENVTFLVTVYGFQTPIKIVISFSQSPPINWVLFFVIFAACFVILLVVAGLMWMIKLRIEVYRRNQRHYNEIEQWASRPFASVRLELVFPRATFMATPIAVEPCNDYRTGIFTLAVRLPTGGRQFTPHGTSGLAVASAICLLTPAQLGVLQAPKNSDAHHNRKTTIMRYIPFIGS
uniref:CUB domain-containing protein n=1 Tax=Syphacia muris TaxID=451379 RepID=A0A0N5AIM8_9BILA